MRSLKKKKISFFWRGVNFKVYLVNPIDLFTVLSFDIRSLEFADLLIVKLLNCEIAGRVGGIAVV